MFRVSGPVWTQSASKRRKRHFALKILKKTFIGKVYVNLISSTTNLPMSTRVLGMEDGKTVVCSFCMVKQLDPQTLNCSHIKCDECIVHFALDDEDCDNQDDTVTVICTTCATDTKFERNKMEKLKELVERRKRNQGRIPVLPAVCMGCDESPVEYKCTGCNRFFCRQCKKFHLKVTTCTDNMSESIAELAMFAKTTLVNTQLVESTIAMLNLKLRNILTRYDIDEKKITLMVEQKKNESFMAYFHMLLGDIEATFQNYTNEVNSEYIAIEQNMLAALEYTKMSEKADQLVMASAYDLWKSTMISVEKFTENFEVVRKTVKIPLLEIEKNVQQSIHDLFKLSKIEDEQESSRPMEFPKMSAKPKCSPPLFPMHALLLPLQATVDLDVAAFFGRSMEKGLAVKHAIAHNEDMVKIVMFRKELWCVCSRKIEIRDPSTLVIKGSILFPEVELAQDAVAFADNLIVIGPNVMVMFKEKKQQVMYAKAGKYRFRAVTANSDFIYVNRIQTNKFFIDRYDWNMVLVDTVQVSGPACCPHTMALIDDKLYLCHNNFIHQVQLSTGAVTQSFQIHDTECSYNICWADTDKLVLVCLKHDHLIVFSTQSSKCYLLPIQGGLVSAETATVDKSSGVIYAAGIQARYIYVCQ